MHQTILFLKSPVNVNVICLTPEMEEKFKETVKNKKLKHTKTQPHIEILGDSHVKNIGAEVFQHHKQALAFSMPDANMDCLIHNLNTRTAHLTPQDFFILIDGTNDFELCKNSNEEKLKVSVNIENYRNVLTQAAHKCSSIHSAT